MREFNHLIITGAPRSGTTALAQLLGQQNRVFVMNEVGIYDDWENKYKWRNFINSKDWINFIANDIIFKSHGIDLYDFRELVLINKFSGEDIFEWLHNTLDVDIIGDKCPITYLQNMLVFKNKFPNAKFIIVVRDGRDVIASQIRSYYKWPPGSLDHADHWMKPTIKLAQSVWLDINKLTVVRLNQIDSNRLFFFRYEDAVNTPKKFEVEISEFLGVDICNISDYFKPTNIGKWKETHPNMMEELSADFKSMLKRFEYD